MAGSYQLGQVSVFDNLKLEQPGDKQEICLEKSKSKYTTMGSSNIGGINGLVASSTRGNALIKPERTTELEFGTDFTLLSGLASFGSNNVYAKYC